MTAPVSALLLTATCRRRKIAPRSAVIADTGAEVGGAATAAAFAVTTCVATFIAASVGRERAA